MSGILVRQSDKQLPCAICGKDAFSELQRDRLVALKCPDCGLVACMPCSLVTGADGVGQFRCPKCDRSGMPIYLNQSLMQNSVKTMPPQTLEGWPELTEVVYHKMIGEVAHNLPLLTAVLKDIIPENDMAAVVERLCFGLSTAKYLEWCYNRQEDVRTYTNVMPRPDFEAPSLPKMVEMICGLIAEQAKTTMSVAILEDNDRRRDEMVAVLKETYPDVDVSVHSDAPNFIALMKKYLRWVNLVCLDHDLEPPADDLKRDMGDGRDAVRWLISQPHKVPVLIHTTNSRCGSEMETMLKDAGWQVYWTPPYEDLAWVRKSWIMRVGEMLGRIEKKV